MLRQDPHTGSGSWRSRPAACSSTTRNNLRSGFERIDERPAQLLHARLHAEQRHLRRQVPEDRGQGEAAGVTVASRQGLLRRARPRRCADQRLGGAGARRARAEAACPTRFPVRAGALLFPERDRPGLVPVVVEFKTAPITFQPVERRQDLHVRLRRDRPLPRSATIRSFAKSASTTKSTGRLSRLERAKQGDVIFYREPELPPGVYTMETVVYDAPSGKSSVRLSTVEVPRDRPPSCA